MHTFSPHPAPDGKPRLPQKHALRNRRSLNQEALYCLEQATGLVRETDDLRSEWLDASAQSLTRDWDNKADEVYNELLEK